jgi:molecular chaperone DnaK
LIKDLRDAVSQEDDEKIKTLTTELQQALYSISANLYQQAGGPEPGAAPGGAGGPEPGAAPGGESGGGDDVIDAEFEESR